MATKLARTVNNLTSVVTVLVLLLGGVLLLVWAATSLSGWFGTVIEQAGGTLLVAALLTVAWEAFGRRALAGEVMEAANLSAEVQQFGLTDLGTDFRKIPFSRLLEADKIDVYLGFGRSWYSTNSTSLQAATKRPTTTIRVILADPTDEAAVECMAQRFRRSTAEVKSNIMTATENFLALGRGAAGKVEVYPLRGTADVALSVRQRGRRHALQPSPQLRGLPLRGVSGGGHVLRVRREGVRGIAGPGCPTDWRTALSDRVVSLSSEQRLRRKPPWIPCPLQSTSGPETSLRTTST